MLDTFYSEETVESVLGDYDVVGSHRQSESLPPPLEEEVKLCISGKGEFSKKSPIYVSMEKLDGSASHAVFIKGYTTTQVFWRPVDWKLSLYGTERFDGYYTRGRNV